MSKRMIITLGFMAVLLITGSRILSGGAKPITKDLLESYVFTPDLVIQGEIKEVTPKEYKLYEIISTSSRGWQIVTEIVIDIEKVIAGNYDKDKIKCFLLEGELGEKWTRVSGNAIIKPNSGERVLVSLHFNVYGHSRYLIDWRSAFFKLEGDSLVPYDITRTLAVKNPMEVIERKAQERKLPFLYKSVDLICTGYLVENKLNEDRLVLRLDEILKGIEDDELITIDYSNQYSIDKDKKGTKWLFFLKEHEYEYKLFAGINGVYFIEDGKLIRDFNIIRWNNIKSFKEEIKVFREDQ